MAPLLFVPSIPSSSRFTPRLATPSHCLTIQTSSCSVLLSSEKQFPPYLPKQVEQIREQAAIDLLRLMNRVPIPVNLPLPKISSSENPIPVLTNHHVTKGCSQAHSGFTPIVLIHGFDSSLLEYRRLIPHLQEILPQNTILCAFDVLGWGFTERPTIDRPDLHNFIDAIYDSNAKRAHLNAYLDYMFPDQNQKVILVGASIGGAVATDYALARPNRVKGLIMIDGQVFIDAGQVKKSPPFVEALGVSVLKSAPLRSIANWVSYYDKSKFATKDALNIGRLQCFMQDWNLAQRGFIRGQRYNLSREIQNLHQGVFAAVIWGNKDKVLDPKYARQFLQVLGEHRCSVDFVPDCGHVPHLEAPVYTAQLILKALHRIDSHTQHMTVSTS